MQTPIPFLVLEMFFFGFVFVILMMAYIKMFVRIVPAGTHYRHYRKGVLWRESSSGGMIIRIPFIDRLEVGEFQSETSDDRFSPQEKAIRKQATVMADISDVWEAWTTAEGVRTFFAPEAKVDLRIGGTYEMYFDPAAPQGSKGGEGVIILSYLPMEMLSFTWNAPPSFPTLRRERTWVVVHFESLDNQATLVTLTHCGWGRSSAWEDLYAYFQRAWEVVMDRLTRRFIEGPIDWNQQGY